jgi:hypothetical protein
MRLFSFLAKFTFICNIAFLLDVITVTDRFVTVSFLKDILVILGISALVINSLMNIFYLIFLFMGKGKSIPAWLAVANFLFLIAEYFYFVF